MKLLRLALLLFFIGAILQANAQQKSNEKILGCWKVKSVEFLQVMEEADEIRQGALGMVVCLEENGKFLTKMPAEKGGALVGTGVYKIEADGKTLSQKRDADDESTDMPSEIVKLTASELSLKVEFLILHYERVEAKK